MLWKYELDEVVTESTYFCKENMGIEIAVRWMEL